MQFFEKGRVAFEAICKHAFFILHMGFPIKARWEMLPVHSRPSAPAAHFISLHPPSERCFRLADVNILFCSFNALQAKEPFHIIITSAPHFIDHMVF